MRSTSDAGAVIVNVDRLPTARDGSTLLFNVDIGIDS